MKYVWLLIVALAAVSLSGCANDMMEIPVSALTNEKSRMKAYSVLGDTSTAKEAIVHKTWQNYHDEYQKAYKESGFTMGYQPVKLADGSTTYLPLVSFKPQPQMAAPPTEPSQHPVWKTVDNVVNRGIMWAGIGWIAHEFRGMNEAAYDAAGNTYNGPVAMKGSYNTAGNDQNITMAGTQNTNTGTEANQGADGGSSDDGDGTNLGTCSGDRGSTPIIRKDDDGTEWVSSGCSCDSWLAGHCDV